MSRRLVPIIGTNEETGEKIRFPSVKAAAEWLGVHGGQISNAIVIGNKLHGYRWSKEEEGPSSGSGSRSGSRC